MKWLLHLDSRSNELGHDQKSKETLVISFHRVQDSIHRLRILSISAGQKLIILACKLCRLIVLSEFVRQHPTKTKYRFKMVNSP